MAAYYAAGWLSGFNVVGYWGLVGVGAGVGALWSCLWCGAVLIGVVGVCLWPFPDCGGASGLCPKSGVWGVRCSPSEVYPAGKLQ